MELKLVHADSEAGGLYVELSHRRPRTPLLRSAFLALSAACCLHGSFGLGRAMVTVIEENSRSADVNEVEENLMMNRGTDFHSRGKTLDRAPLSQVRGMYTGDLPSFISETAVRDRTRTHPRYHIDASPKVFHSSLGSSSPNQHDEPVDAANHSVCVTAGEARMVSMGRRLWAERLNAYRCLC